ncbi:MAG: serine/threonine protein kinase [Pseudomonadales bacterium]|nr:serine/threonine protein kinase [Pseudomonadales bacterium]
MNNVDALPKKIDKYEITRVLGQGAMGIVYQGYDKRIDRQVAIKVLHPHLRQGEMGTDLVARFNQEAKAAARCFHPNIVTVFDFGSSDDSPFIVMEYVQGVELKAKLKGSDSLPLSASIEITLQILEALAYAHDQGVVHRDIKPANIILLDDGRIKVSDFGVARLDTSELTNTGFMVGTPNYMSPEGLRGDAVDSRSDLYSTGLLLFELITSQKLARGIPLEEALLPIHKARHLTPAQATQLSPIIEKSLQAMPRQRYQSAEELIRGLRSLEDYDADEGKTLLKQVSLVRKTDRQSSPSSPTQDDPSNLSQWNPDVLKSVENNLAKYIGPMARYVVHNIAKKSRTVTDLSESLASQIPNQKERTQFLKELKKSGIRETPLNRSPNASQQSSQNKGIPPELVNEASKDLTYYMGPLASRLVKKVARSANSREDFYKQLAQHIPDEKERAQFLRKKIKY